MVAPVAYGSFQVIDLNHDSVTAASGAMLDPLTHCTCGGMVPVPPDTRAAAVDS